MRAPVHAGGREASRPLLSTKTMFLVFFIGLIALWAGVSLLFYLEIP